MGSDNHWKWDECIIFMVRQIWKGTVEQEIELQQQLKADVSLTTNAPEGAKECES